MADKLSEKRIRAIILKRMPIVNKKREASEWYIDNLPELKKRYNGKFIAILGKGENLKSSDTVDDLIKQLDEPSLWFIKFVSEGRVIYA